MLRTDWCSCWPFLQAAASSCSRSNFDCLSGFCGCHEGMFRFCHALGESMRFIHLTQVFTLWSFTFSASLIWYPSRIGACIRVCVLGGNFSEFSFTALEPWLCWFGGTSQRILLFWELKWPPGLDRWPSVAVWAVAFKGTISSEVSLPSRSVRLNSPNYTTPFFHHYFLDRLMNNMIYCIKVRGARWLSGRVSDSGAKVGGSIPAAAVLCPWARHFTPRKYWLITQEAVAPSQHDWKIVDWDVKPQHKQTKASKWWHSTQVPLNNEIIIQTEKSLYENADQAHWLKAVEFI